VTASAEAVVPSSPVRAIELTRPRHLDATPVDRWVRGATVTPYAGAVPERAPEVEQVIRKWLDAKQAADGDRIRAGLSAYSSTLAIGTEASEWWAGAEAFAAAHSSGAPFTALLEHVEAHGHGAVAWAAVRAVINTGEPGGDAGPSHARPPARG
jgi:hypothetical protein